MSDFDHRYKPNESLRKSAKDSPAKYRKRWQQRSDDQVMDNIRNNQRLYNMNEVKSDLNNFIDTKYAYQEQNTIVFNQQLLNESSGDSLETPPDTVFRPQSTHLHQFKTLEGMNKVSLNPQLNLS